MIKEDKKIKDLQDKEINQLPLVVGLRSTINDLQCRVSDLQRNIGQQKQFEYELIQNVEKYDPYLPTYNVPNDVKVSSPVAAVVQFGDWHIGEMTDKSDTGGFGEYNYKIAQDRIFKITDSIIQWIELHRNSYNIKTCYILDIGDNISGDIHHELTVTNEFPVPEQIIKAAYLKAEVFRRLASNFKNVKVIWVAPDNHSRKVKKPQAKQAGKNSENYLVGFLTKTMLENIENIEFTIILSHQAVVKIGDQTYLCEHGNTIRSYMGFPWYGADRKVGREAKRMMTKKGFDKLVIQHFHVPMNTQYFIVGGSLSGTSEYDSTQGRYSEPTQCVWMVHPKHGEFDWCAFRG
ncbi:MAG: hypothetical protein ACTSXD_04745 [Candidatus Heimdallarchaeaceae archaeon]